MELEVKLGFSDKKSLTDFMSSDRFLKYCPEPEKASTSLLENSYLDTAGLTVTKRSGMIRVRHYSSDDDDRYEFTVKYGGGISAGLHRRYEWNVDSDNGVFSIEDFKRGAVSENDDSSELLEEAFKGVKDGDLSVVCSNSFTRTVYTLVFGKSTVEACFDSGFITGSSGTVAEEICELELELKEGNINDIKALSAIVIAEADCAPLDKTKYGRTLALAMGNGEN